MKLSSTLLSTVKVVFLIGYVFCSYRWFFEGLGDMHKVIKIALLVIIYLVLRAVIYRILRSANISEQQTSSGEQMQSETRMSNQMDPPMRDWAGGYKTGAGPSPQAAPAGRAGSVTYAPSRPPIPAPLPNDSVQISLSCPAQIVSNEEFSFQVGIHLPEQQATVLALFQQLSPADSHVMAAQQCCWQRGTKVMIRAAAQHITITPAEQEFIWEGHAIVLAFDANGTTLRAGQRVSLKIDVLIAGIVIARIRKVLIATTLVSDRPSTQVVHPYRSAFASYASADTNLVIGRLHEIERNGVTIFWDRLSLQTGKDWKTQLHEAIVASDCFILFWSRHAAASEWVTWEWQTALETKGIERIDPHPLETAAEAPPPPALRSLHFDDKYLYFRKPQ